MGAGVARNLLRNGYNLEIFDLEQKNGVTLVEEGARWAESPQALAEECEVIFTSLPTPDAVNDICFGAEGVIDSFKAGSAWFDLSTNSVSLVREIESALRKRSVSYLDAPISGGPTGAASGKMAIWIGGDREVFDKHLPVLESISSQVLYIGEIGAGTISKLVHNVASLSISAIVSEVMTLGVKAGVEPAALWQAMRSGAAGRSRTFDNVSQRFLQGKLDPASFALSLAHKDISLGMELARDTSVPMRMCNLTHQDMTEALNRGWGDRDAQSFLLLQQQRGNIKPFSLSEDDVNSIMAESW